MRIYIYSLLAVILSVVPLCSTVQMALAADEINVTGNAQALNTTGVIDFSNYNSNVKVNNVTHQFSGYGWSRDIGWVAFGTTDNPDGPVTYDPTSGLLSGKAMVLNTGIALDFNAAPHNSNVRAHYDGTLDGYAWSEDIGWFNFTGVSAVGIALTSPNAPANVTIYDVSNRSAADYAVLTRWEQPPVFDTASFKDYVIDRSTDGVTYATVSATTSRAYYDTSVSTGTTYYYKIKTRYLTNETFAATPVSMEPTGRYTTPPTLTGGPNATIEPTSVTITWNTNRNSNSYVSIKEGNTFVSEQGQSDFVTEHEVKVLGLKPQRQYYYTIKSMDEDGNELIGNETSITTTNSPSIYDVELSNLSLSSVVINFKSTSISNFTLYYGKTADYGDSVSEQSGSNTTNHSLSLDNLESGTMYYYRILGEDSNGNELKSENSFVTPPLPSISDFDIEPVKASATTTIKVSFVSNVPISTSVFYKRSGDAKFSENSSSDLTENHSVEISNLTDNSQYQIYVAGRDQFGNLAESGETVYLTPLDTRPPQVSNVSVEASNIGSDAKEDESRLIVSWVTDEPSSSFVEYGEGVSADYYTGKTVPDTEMTTKHLVVVTGLKPGAPYHLRVASADVAGNTGYSSDQSVVAGEAQKSILQMVLQTLKNIFGWMGGMVE